MALEWMTNTKGPEFMMAFLKDNPEYMMAYNLLYPIIPIGNPDINSGQAMYEKYLKMDEKEKEAFKIGFELTYLLQDTDTMDVLLNAPGVNDALDRYIEGTKMFMELSDKEKGVSAEQYERLLMDFSNVAIALLSINPGLLTPKEAAEAQGFFKIIKEVGSTKTGVEATLGTVGAIAYFIFALVANRTVLTAEQRIQYTVSSSMLKTGYQIGTGMYELGKMGSATAEDVGSMLSNTEGANVFKAMSAAMGTASKFFAPVWDAMYNGMNKLLMGFLSDDLAPFAKEVGKFVKGVVYDASISTGVIEEVQTVPEGALDEIWSVDGGEYLLEYGADANVAAELDTVIYGESTWALTESASSVLGTVGGVVVGVLDVVGAIYAIYFIFSTIRDLITLAEEAYYRDQRWKKIEKNLGMAWKNAVQQSGNYEQSEAYQMWQNYDKIG